VFVVTVISRSCRVSNRR